MRIAISASSAAVGSGLTPQSAKTSSPSSPSSVRGVTISMNDETFLTPARTPIPRMAARSVSAVVERAPATIPSNWPEATPDAAHSNGSSRCLRAFLEGDAAPGRALEVRAQGRIRLAAGGHGVEQRHAGDAERPLARAAGLDGARRGALGRGRCAGGWIVRGSVPSGSTMCRGARGPRMDPREDVHGTRTLTCTFVDSQGTLVVACAILVND